MKIATRRFAASFLMLMLQAWAGAALLAGQQAVPADLDFTTAPVELDGVELFRVRGVSALPAATRAGMIRDRIAAVAADPAFPVDALHVVDSEGVVRIVAGDRPIMGVVEADAALEQVSRQELAAAQAFRIQEAVAAYRAARTRDALWRAACTSLLATLVLAATVAAVLWLSRWLDRMLTRTLQARIHSVGIQQFEVMRADRIWAALRSLLLGTRTVLLLASALAYVGYVLGQWPWTHGVARDMASFALAPVQIIARGVVANIPSLIFLAVLWFVTRLALRVVRLFFEAVHHGRVVLSGFDAEWAQPTYKIVRVVIVAFAVVVAYPYIPGSDSDAFKSVSLFLGIVFSLGSSSAISNVIAGYMMTYRRAFKVGDRVKIGGAVGDVVEMRLQVTHLRTVKNEEVVLPNSQILSVEVLNYSSLARTKGLILHTEVGIGYETSWRQVEAMLLAAAGRTSGLSPEPGPFVLLKTLGDFAVVYELNAYCRDVQSMAALYTGLHRNILDVFNEHGVQIMTPAYEADPAVPKVVRPADWYAASAPAPPVSTAARPG